MVDYAEVARTASLEDATKPGFVYVYGSNLQHALRLAREASRRTGSSRIVLVTYTLPSAHHLASGDVYFKYPPIPESLEVTRVEARACASDGIHIDTFLVVRDSAGAESVELEEYFRPVTEGTGGKIVLVTPDNEVGDSIDRLVSG